MRVNPCKSFTIRSVCFSDFPYFIIISKEVSGRLCKWKSHPKFLLQREEEDFTFSHPFTQHSISSSSAQARKKSISRNIYKEKNGGATERVCSALQVADSLAI